MAKIRVFGQLLFLVGRVDQEIESITLSIPFGDRQKLLFEEPKYASKKNCSYDFLTIAIYTTYVVRIHAKHGYPVGAAVTPRHSN